MSSKSSNSSNNGQEGKLFEYNSYAKAVNSTGQLARRHQSIHKINEYGMGVIYVWDWQWSFSEKLYDKGLKDPEIADYGRLSKSNNGIKRSSGRFMYLGLSIQQPTSNRMADHIKDAKTKKSVEYAALGQAIYNTFGSGEPYRKFENPMDVPKIIHMSSLFDLATLEEHFIKRYGLAQTQKVYNNFEQLVNDYSENVLKNSKLSGVTGVNTAGGGQGGPLKGITWRGPREWIMAAYFFLKERDNTILESRNTEMENIYKQATEKKMINGKEVPKTIDEQILSVVEGFLGITGGNIVAPRGVTIKILKEIDLPLIQNTIKGLGVRDKDLTSREFDAKFNEDGTLTEKATSDDFNIKIKDLTYEKGTLGFILSEALTVEMRPGEKRTGVRKLIAGKTEGGATKVRAEFRDMIFSNILDSIPKDPNKIEKYNLSIKTMLNDLDTIAETFFSASYDYARINKQIAESKSNIEKIAKETEKKMLIWSKKIAELKAKVFMRNAIEEPTSKRAGFKIDKLKASSNELKEKEEELGDILNNMAEEIHNEERKVANAIVKAGQKKKKEKADKVKD